MTPDQYRAVLKDFEKDPSTQTEGTLRYILAEVCKVIPPTDWPIAIELQQKTEEALNVKL